MNKRIVSFLLAFTLAFSFTSISLKAEEVVVEEKTYKYGDIENSILSNNFNEVEGDLNSDISLMYIPGAVEGGVVAGVATAEAFAYLLGAFGLVSASKLVYDNIDELKAWGNERIDEFTDFVVTTGTATAGTVSSWLDKLATGVLDIGSDIYGAFKGFMDSLYKTANTAPAVGGVLTANVENDVTVDLATPVVPAPGTGKPFVYDLFTIKPNVEGTKLLAVKYTNSNTGESGNDVYIFGPNPGFAEIRYSLNTSNSVTTTSAWFNRYTVSVNGTTYYYGRVDTRRASVGSIPAFDTNVVSIAIKEYVTTPPSPSLGDYKQVGAIGDIYTNKGTIGTIGIGNTGNVSYPLGQDEVYINYGNVATGSIAGALAGVQQGTLTWTDAVTSTGVVVTEKVETGEVVVGEEGTTDIPYAPELGALDDYKVSLADLFPFCLPFDLIDFINVLAREPRAPYFEYDMPLPAGINGGSYKFVIDLSDFDSAAKLLRDMQCLLFIVGLIILTRDKMIRG